MAGHENPADPEADLYSALPEQPTGANARALEAAQGWIGGSVSGVGLGQRDNNPAILVYVDSDASEAVKDLPDEIEGLPVVIQHSGPFTASPADN